MKNVRFKWWILVLPLKAITFKAFICRSSTTIVAYVNIWQTSFRLAFIFISYIHSVRLPKHTFDTYFDSVLFKREREKNRKKMSFDTIPKDLRGLRACLVCSLVKVILLFHPIQSKFDFNQFHAFPCIVFPVVRPIWNGWLWQLRRIFTNEKQQRQCLRLHQQQFRWFNCGNEPRR